MMRRIGDILYIGDEEFHVSDLLSIYPKYAYMDSNVHFYDGKHHYISDGVVQRGCPIPYAMGDELLRRIPELKMCRRQRINDEQHFENLRNGRR